MGLNKYRAPGQYNVLYRLWFFIVVGTLSELFFLLLNMHYKYTPLNLQMSYKVFWNKTVILLKIITI